MSMREVSISFQLRQQSGRTEPSPVQSEKKKFNEVAESRCDPDNRKDDAYEFMKTREHALNAAACINNYTPASMNELIRNNAAFQSLDQD